MIHGSEVEEWCPVPSFLPVKEEENEANDATVEQASAGVVASRAEIRKELKRLQAKLKELDGSTLCSTDG